MSLDGFVVVNEWLCACLWMDTWSSLDGYVCVCVGVDGNVCTRAFVWMRVSVSDRVTVCAYVRRGSSRLRMVGGACVFICASVTHTPRARPRTRIHGPPYL